MAGPSSITIPVPPSDRRAPRKVASVIKHPIKATKEWSLTAASKRIKRKEIEKNRRRDEWREEAWAMYDQVGELHFAANTYANTYGSLKMVLTRTNENGEKVHLDDLSDDELIPEDLIAIQAMQDLAGDAPSGMAELQRMAGLQLFVPGGGLLVGVPPEAGMVSDEELDAGQLATGQLTSLVWKVYAEEEVKTEGSKIKVAGRPYEESEVLVIRFWRTHPRDCKASDSPVRASMPVLRELVGLTMKVSADIDSRLAGAGVFVIPSSATALGVAPPEEGEEPDDVVDALIEAGVTPIKDRDSAAAVVPVVLTVPDDCGFQPFHISFSTPLDAAAKELRDEAIRRLALAFDMPAETLLGLGDSSHWNAWAIQADYLKQHIVPGGQIFADAVVRDYLRPVLLEANVDLEKALDYSLEPSAEDIVDRPNRTQEALDLYNAGAITSKALLDEAGFDADAAPDKPDTDPAVEIALQLVQGAPTLIADPGLPVLVSQIRAVLEGKDASNAPEDALDESPAPTPPAAPAAPGEDEQTGEQAPQGPPNGGAPNAPGQG